MTKIKLSELTEALDNQPEDSTTYFDRKTGKIHFLFDGMLDGENISEEEMEKLEMSDDLITFPSDYEINDYEIMRDFIYSLPESRMQDQLFRAIQGRGAFRRFREVLDDYEMSDHWYHFRDASYEKIGRNWAERNDIEVEEDIPSVLKYLNDSAGEGEVEKILIAVDMQNDFIDGSLGTKEAIGIVPRAIEKIQRYPSENVYATRDTHPENYLETQEGTYLPIKHCIQGTKGWQIRKDIAKYINPDHIFDKPTFGSVRLAEEMKMLSEKKNIEIELIGLCTDICVISNALLLKAYMPEIKISVDPKCCAGVTPEKHQAALETMKSCQIQMADD